MIGETVTVITPASTTDERGNTVADWSDDTVTSTVVSGALWAPSTQTEDRADGRQGVPITGTLYLPQATSIAATDRVVVRGDVFDVNSEPAVWGDAGVEVLLRRSRG